MAAANAAATGAGGSRKQYLLPQQQSQQAQHALESSGGVWVRMKGLPPKARPDDVLQFLQGCRIAGGAAGILFKRHPDGRTTGEAYVCMASAADAAQAVARDCAIFSPRFGQRYVHVYETGPEDSPHLQQAGEAAQSYEAAQQAAAADGGNQLAAVLVRNFPPEAGQRQLVDFFAGFDIHPNGLQLGMQGHTHRTGQAFVEFASANEAARAVERLDRQPLRPKVSKRFVRLEQITLTEMREALSLRFGGEGIVRVKPAVSAAEVAALFPGLPLRPGGIHSCQGQDGAAAGTAFLEFETPADAVRALEAGRAASAGQPALWVRLATRSELRRANTSSHSSAHFQVATRAAPQHRSVSSSPTVQHAPRSGGSPILDAARAAAECLPASALSSATFADVAPGWRHRAPVSAAMLTQPGAFATMAGTEQLLLSAAAAAAHHSILDNDLKAVLPDSCDNAAAAVAAQARCDRLKQKYFAEQQKTSGGSGGSQKHEHFAEQQRIGSGAASGSLAAGGGASNACSGNRSGVSCLEKWRMDLAGRPAGSDNSCESSELQTASAPAVLRPSPRYPQSSGGQQISPPPPFAAKGPHTMLHQLQQGLPLQQHQQHGGSAATVSSPPANRSDSRGAGQSIAGKPSDAHRPDGGKLVHASGGGRSTVPCSLAADAAGQASPAKRQKRA